MTSLNTKDLENLIQRSKVYAGIGSRQTPTSTQNLMIKISKILASKGLTLRSGGANGADAAFEKGCSQNKGEKEIYLPFELFNKNTSQFFHTNAQAFEVAKNIHPAWHKCSPLAKKLHARNVHQILGIDLKSPCDFVVYYAPTENSKVLGGTATAVNLAISKSIPTFNLLEPNIQELWMICTS